jgi:PTH1 family peptidyl-tRNA hydrolase
MDLYLIVGLGNPGRKYAENRHNVGFRSVSRLAAAHHLRFDQRQKNARVARGTVEGRDVLLAKPRTFMNRSGRPVSALAQFYKVPLKRIMVVYDDLDLPLGAIRLRPEGGSGGHKGVKSVIEHLGNQREFPRLRIGIDRPPGRMDPAAYVLQDFSAEEEPVLDDALRWAVATLEVWLCEGIEAAMNLYNQREWRERIGAPDLG